MSQGELEQYIESIFQNFDSYLKNELSDKTRKAYVYEVRMFVMWLHDRAVFPSLVSKQIINDYHSYLDRSHFAVSSIHVKSSALRCFFRWGASCGLVQSSDMVEGRKLKRDVSLAPSGLSDYHVRRLKVAAVDLVTLADKRRRPDQITPKSIFARRDRAILYTLLLTGLRVGEVSVLRLGDLELSERSGSVRVWAGKGNKSRNVPINADLRVVLRDWLAFHPSSESLPLFEEEDPFLFVGQRGALGEGGIRSSLARICRQAGIMPAVNPHAFRHTFAKSLIDQGVSITQVQALLGHSSIITTSRYTKPSKEDLERSVDLL